MTGISERPIAQEFVRAYICGAISAMKRRRCVLDARAQRLANKSLCRPNGPKSLSEGRSPG